MTANSFYSVMLLGQAESGKSTLQKQFQLYYASQTLDHERPSWRPVVYLNIITAVRIIVDEIEHAYRSSSDSGIDEDLRDDTLDHGYAEVSQLRNKLLPLVEIEKSLASELNGGISVTRKGTYVRPGWQTLTTGHSPTPDIKDSTAVTSAAGALAATFVDIESIWRHSFVKALLNLGKLRLEESHPLYVSFSPRISPLY